MTSRSPRTSFSFSPPGVRRPSLLRTLVSPAGSRTVPRPRWQALRVRSRPAGVSTRTGRRSLPVAFRTRARAYSTQSASSVASTTAPHGIQCLCSRARARSTPTWAASCISRGPSSGGRSTDAPNCSRRASATTFERRSFPVRESSKALIDTAIVQPALFTVEYALARLLMTLGLGPVATIGHSIGEYVSACLAGVFSLEDALALVAERGRLMQLMPAGAMAAIGLAESALRPRLVPGVAIAAVNGPEICLVSGPTSAVQSLERTLVADQVMVRRLHASHAFHSPMMLPIVEPFRRAVAAVSLRPPTLRSCRA